MSDNKQSAIFSIDKYIKFLDSHGKAVDSYPGYCLEGINDGLDAGFSATKLRKGSIVKRGVPYAKDYGPSLIKLGFTEITNKNWAPQKGDTVIFDTWQGQHHIGKKGKWHPAAGHIEAYDGLRWVSDCMQSKFLPNRKAKEYRIYRPPNGASEPLQSQSQASAQPAAPIPAQVPVPVRKPIPTSGYEISQERMNSIIKQILFNEGGYEYTNIKDDKGGKTRYGVIESNARSQGYKGDMRDYPLSLAIQYYKKMITSDNIDKLPPPLDMLVADGRTNIHSQINNELYESLGLKTIKHSASTPISKEAINKSWELYKSGRIKDIGHKIIALRLKFHNERVQKNPSQLKFLQGWINRCATLDKFDETDTGAPDFYKENKAQHAKHPKNRKQKTS